MERKSPQCLDLCVKREKSKKKVKTKEKNERKRDRESGKEA